VYVIFIEGKENMSVNKKHLKELKRKKQLKEKLLIEQRIKELKKEEEITKRAKESLNKENKIIHKIQKENTNLHINYFADRNGCGYYRIIWPSELLSTMRNMHIINSFIYIKDISIIKFIKSIRWQRQATTDQLNVFQSYLDAREREKFSYRMDYEIDDLLMEIDPSNKVAYDFFNPVFKENHLNFMRKSDRVILSTDMLKKVYTKKYGIDESKIMVIKNMLPLFLYNHRKRTLPKEFNNTDKKPRILWSGSASHVGKGGDLDFLIPLIEKTLDEYQWVFQGTIPQVLHQYVDSGKIEFYNWSPTYGLSNSVAYSCKPDISLVPLKPSLFNSCKSNLKLLEGSSIGVPVITTSFQESNIEFEGEMIKSPYDDIANICIEPDPEIWKIAIDHLINDPNYYMDVINNQYNVLNNFWMENYIDEWKRSYD
jgi:glycosyltransferase involved in cell wall biosynthesis